MHLVEACRTRFTMVAVIHEVTAVVAAEYFNETHAEGRKAFALVTAGPGLTNAVTGISGAWLEIISSSPHRVVVPRPGAGTAAVNSIVSGVAAGCRHWFH